MHLNIANGLFDKHLPFLQGCDECNRLSDASSFCRLLIPVVFPHARLDGYNISYGLTVDCRLKVRKGNLKQPTIRGSSKSDMHSHAKRGNDVKIS